MIDMLDNHIVDVEVYNSIGDLVWTYTSPELKHHQVQVDLKKASGVYMIHIRTNSGLIKQRIVITN
ncbi:MAG: T9SS type A sorting domain-containing protein, partial [Bacteroidota bacterium]